MDALAHRIAAAGMLNLKWDRAPVRLTGDARNQARADGVIVFLIVRSAVDAFA